jgi:hypothetical protein
MAMMQRWVTVLVGFAVTVLAFALVAKGYQPPKAIGHDPNPSSSAHPDDNNGTSGLGDAGAAATAMGGQGSVPDAGALLLSDYLAAEPRIDGGVGATMPDGTPVPMLPPGTPREVHFGVVLVSYAGAQPNPVGGRAATRSKADARTLADRLLLVARQDFHAAVQQGDPGSADDVGRVKLGLLEPAPEYVLFTLRLGGGTAGAEQDGAAPGASDDVGGPVDTPRGFWIVKRLD